MIDSQLVSVVSDGGKTVISGLDLKTREILRQRLFTAGELLKRGQLASLAIAEAAAHSRSFRKLLSDVQAIGSS